MQTPFDSTALLIGSCLQVIELPIKHPELFDALGIAQPKGVLLYGPPGTGKTLLARAVAHHTDCCFIRVSGSELVQKYIGEGARMVRELFVMARYDMFDPDHSNENGVSLTYIRFVCGMSGNTPLLLSSWMRWIPSVVLVLIPVEVVIRRCSAPCWSCSVNLMGLSPLRTSRC